MKNKGYILITCIITLLPMLVGIYLWPQLPDKMATHFGIDNVPDGFSSKGFTVFGLPLILLLVHIICAFVTLLDPKGKGINKKFLRIILVFCPMTSIFCGITFYGYIIKPDINIDLLVNLFCGIIFIIIGNYLPKCRQNYTVGIKIPWTLDSEDNWSRTHRLAGWVWVLCGLFFIMNIFVNFGGWIYCFTIGIMVIVPVGYSFLYYLKHNGTTK